MRMHTIRTFALPGALAALAAVLTLAYAAHGGPQQAAAAGTASVYVATHDIAAGTAGVDAMHALKLVHLPAAAVAPDAVTTLATLGGRIAVEPIYRGEQATLRRFAGLSDQGLVSQLSGRQRAIQIAGDANQLLAGTLRDGDRVDVVASLKTPDKQVPYGRTVLRNILVLHAPPAPSGSPVSGGQQAFAATLRLSDTQAQTLFFVTKNGDWALVLRPAVHAGDGADFVDSTASVLGSGR